jgi:putative lipase involved disintegration of autophagic bodies
MAAVQVVNMLVNQIADSISNGDFERAFIKFKNNNAFKRIIENAKEAKQLKIDSKVTVDNLKAGDKIRSVIADSEFLIEDVVDKDDNGITVQYTLTNPEELGLDKDSVKNSAKVTLTEKDLKYFSKVL